MRNINEIIDKFRKENKKTSDFTNNGIGLFLNSYGLYKEAFILQDPEKEDGFYNREPEISNLNKILMNNVVVNTVTAFEVFLKYTIINGQYWDEEGYKKLLDEEIKLSAAYDLFSHEKVTRQYIIAHSRSFQNDDIINKVFSKLAGEDFFDAIKKVSMNLPFVVEEPTTLMSSNPKWRQTLREIFETRHNYIHDGVGNEITVDQLDNYFFTILAMISAIEIYVLDRAVAKAKVNNSSKPNNNLSSTILN